MARLSEFMLAGILAALLLLFPFRIALENPVAKVERSIVSVEYYTLGQGHICTGFVVNAPKGEALTAKHCLPPDGPFTVDQAPSEVIKSTPMLALVRVQRMVKPALEINEKPMWVTEKVLTFGYGYGHMMVLERKFIGLWEGFIVLDGPLIPGMSGGPVIDERGKVVGLNHATNQIIGLAIGQDEIRDFLK